MPHVDGYELCRRIKEDPATAAIPFVMLTAKADLTRTYLDINPAALQRQIQALMNELLTLAITKAGPPRKAPPTRAPANPTTNQLSRASGI